MTGSLLGSPETITTLFINWLYPNWCFWTVVLEKTLESPLDCKEVQPVHPKGDQSWVFIGRTDAEVETPMLWPPHAKSWLIGKDPDAGRHWGQEEKGTTEDEMAGWHHRLNGHESEWTPGVGDGQGGLVCCNSWGHKESDTTERLNWTELNTLVQTKIFKNMTQKNWSTNRNRLTDIENRLVIANGVGEGEGWIGNLGLLYIGWINNKALLYSTGNYIQYHMINQNGKEHEKEYIYV